MKRIFNRFLILCWEVLSLIKSIPGFLNAAKRKGPDFIIIGASKSGTSSLYSYLEKHPKIKLARTKEPRFFNRYYKWGLSYYKSYFPIRKPGELSGEATTSYFYNKEVPARIHKHYPKLKLILLLRNPIYRAYSHFQMNKNDEQNKNFMDAIKQELAGKVTYHYLDSSAYSSNLKNWLKYFSREQILIIKSESFFNNPSEKLSEVFSFLELEPLEMEPLLPLNQNQYEALSQIDYFSLEEILKEETTALADLLGAEFTWSR